MRGEGCGSVRDLIEALDVLEMEQRGLLGKSKAARALVRWAWSTLMGWALDEA